jgi:hypothetical protein
LQLSGKGVLILLVETASGRAQQMSHSVEGALDRRGVEGIVGIDHLLQYLNETMSGQYFYGNLLSTRQLLYGVDNLIIPVKSL